MEFPTDAKFSNVELAPEKGASGILYVPVKNNVQSYYPNFQPVSVFDKHPDHGTGTYRKEPVLRYNNLREVWEINPYFLESNYISSAVQEPDSNDNDDSDVDDIALPTLVVTNKTPIELDGPGTVHNNLTLSLSKEYDAEITIQIDIDTNTSSYLEFIDASGVIFSSLTIIGITFSAGQKGPITIPLVEKTHGHVMTDSLNETISFTATETTNIGIETLTFNMNIVNDVRPQIAFVDNFSSTNFEDVNSALVPAILGDFSGFQTGDILYTLYNTETGGASLTLDTCLEDEPLCIVSKDLITVQGEFAYVLLQIRGITDLANKNDKLQIADLRFALLREGVFYNMNVKQGANGLTTFLTTTGISKVFEQNLHNGTIQMGNVDYFLQFESTIEISEFAIQDPLAQVSNSLLMMRTGVAKAPMMKKQGMNKTMNALVDNNVYTSEVIDSWMYFDENKYANPISFYSTVKISEHVVITPGDMLAAYVLDSTGNIEIRGVTNTDYNTTSGQGVIPWTYEGETEAVNILETTVFTNSLKSTEFIKFRLFKKDPFILDGETLLEGNSVYELAEELPVGGIKGITGGMYSEGPDQANIFYIGRFTTVLNGPFDDFSFNVEVENPTKEHIFVDGSTSVLSKIKAYRSQDYTAVQVANGVWLSNTTSTGALFANAPLSYKEFYSVRLNDGINTVTLNIDGFPIKSQVDIVLKPGYNWIGYTMFRNETIDNVFKLNDTTVMDNPSALKAIITRDQGSALVNNGQFYGSLTQLRPGGAYVLYIDKNAQPFNLHYPATYSTTTIQEPSGYFKIDSMVNPLTNIIGDAYVYISPSQTQDASEFGIMFLDPNDSSAVTGIKVNGDYTGFGVHNSSMTLLDPQDIEIADIGDFINGFVGVSGNLTSMQIKAGFTTLDGINVNGVNGVLDFVVKKNPDPLSFSDTEPVYYTLSTIGGLLDENKKPPFEFTGTLVDISEVPVAVQTFVGDFVPVVPVVPEDPIVFKVSEGTTANSTQVEVRLRNIIGSDEHSKFNVMELFFDNENFGEADQDPNTNDEIIQIDPSDKVNVLSPPSFPFNILQAQGNAIQLISAEGIPFGTQPIVLEIPYNVSTPNSNSYIADKNYGKYTIPEFNNVTFNDDGVAV